VHINNLKISFKSILKKLGKHDKQSWERMKKCSKNLRKCAKTCECMWKCVKIEKVSEEVLKDMEVWEIML